MSDIAAAPPAGPAFIIPVLAGPESLTPIDGDGSPNNPERVFPPGAFSFIEAPIPGSIMRENTGMGGHVGARLGVARIDRVWRDGQSGVISAVGRFGSSEDGLEAARSVGERMLTGVSVEPRNVEVTETMADDEFGPYVSRVTFDSYEIGAFSIVDIPGFERGQIDLCAEDVYATLMTAEDPAGVMALLFSAVPEPEPVEEPEEDEMPMVASESCSCEGTCPSCAGDERTPLVVVDPESFITVVTASAPRPPASVFADPNLTRPTILQVGEREPWGQPIFGHLAEWTDCHTGFQFVCRRPIPSAAGYSRFTDTGDFVTTAEGTKLAVGHINLHGEHAPERHPDGTWVTEAEARAYYADPARANTGCLVAGGDSVGIWLAGYLPPDTPPEDVAYLLDSYMSGDWREHNGHLELMHASRVDVPGFPVGEQKQALAFRASATFDPDGEPMVMLGAGSSRLAAMVANRNRARVDPEVVALRAELAELRTEVADLRRSVDPLGPLSAAALREGILA